MNIVLKHTFKNIFKKPFRSIVLMLCVMVTCLTAYLSLDMSGTIGDIITGYMADMLGSVDLEVISSKNINMEMLNDLPECVAVTLDATGYPVATRDPEQYSYEYVKDLTIFGIDVDAASKMDMFKEAFTLLDGQIAISTTYSETFGYNVGDVVDIYDVNGVTHPFEVVKILEESGVFIAEHEYTAVVNEKEIMMLNDKTTQTVTELMIDVTDDTQIDTMCDYFEKEHPEFTVTRVKGNKQIQAQISTITMVFTILFVVTFLMVIFVTVSLSEKIVNERMAVIGTLLSLGISRGVTTFILLMENVFYGLIGFLGAAGIYNAIRPSIFNSMIALLQGSMQVSPIQTWVNVVVFAGAILVECTYPAMALIKSTKIAIRDIIFANKDTEYKYSKKKTITGFVLFVLGLALSFTGNGGLMIISIVLIVVAMTNIMPQLIKWIAEGCHKLFGKMNMPVAELAAKECSTKKNTVSNGILCLTVAALAIALFGISDGIQQISTFVSYNADIYLSGATNEPEQYSYLEDIEGVSEVYYEHGATDMPKINGVGDETDIIQIMAFPNKDIFVGVDDLPDALEYDEVALSQTYCKKLGIAEGDTAEMKFKVNGLFPVTRQVKVRYTNSGLYSSLPLMVMNADQFEDIYHDTVTGIYINCENEEAVASVKAEIDKHTLDQSFLAQTFEEWYDEQLKSSASMKMAVTVALAFGVGLAIIGISGNQAIGFEARKREYAVMYSTSMTKNQIKSLIFAETFISMAASVFVGTVLGILLNWTIERTGAVIGFPIQVGLSVSQYITMFIVLVVVLAFTSFGPMRSLKKMNAAEQLKYE